jgi:electron transport complex protein RnfA
MEALALLVGAVLVNNFVLTQFLGLCPFVGVSRRLPDAFAMGLATTFVMTLAAAICHAIDRALLAPFGLDVFSIVVFVFVVAALVQGVEIVLRATTPVLHAALGIYLPLITTNCAVLGVVLLTQQVGLGLAATVLYAAGAAAGFTLVIALFAALREGLVESRIPAAFRGAPIVFVTAGILALAFMGFQGVGR